MALEVNDLLRKLSSDEQVRGWKEKYEGYSFFSTDSNVITYNGILYNVSGSSTDPDEVHGCIGCSWRELLEKKIPETEGKYCYVENSKATDNSSHFKTGPDYVVGGHMTTNKDGHVEVGGETYLMPLCKWDNSTSRNEEPFQVTSKRILVLEGYMLPEPYVTFAARLPAIQGNVFGLVYFDEKMGLWRHKDINSKQAKNLSSANDEDPNQYILFEKSKNKGEECKLQDACM